MRKGWGDRLSRAYQSPSLRHGVDVVLAKDHGPGVVAHQVVHGGRPEIVEPFLDPPEGEDEESARGEAAGGPRQEAGPVGVEKVKVPRHAVRVWKAVVGLEVPGEPFDVPPLNDRAPHVSVQGVAPALAPDLGFDVHGVCSWKKKKKNTTVGGQME